ncbi:MAG TPA: acylneuraminate cytidylyltransferase family protein [Phycisphaerales bacterium]|nr:acylneuraminate cytidylyltransferase family protein [Phycisphaerales bacterium]
MSVRPGPVRRAVAVVLARAGSKGLPHKNARPVAGRPCIAWTIEHARSASSVCVSVVSTDGAALAGIARAEGVAVIERPAELAGDSATVDAAARHAVEALEAGLAQGLDRRVPVADDDAVVILYGNVPVRPAGLVDRAVEMLFRTGCDSVQSYAPVGKHHPWWTARLDATSGTVRAWEGDVLNHNTFRRQDLPPAYIPDGGVIAVTRRALFNQVAGATPGPHQFFGVDRRGVLNREGAVVDIDTRIDLLVADALLRERAVAVSGGVA